MVAVNLVLLSVCLHAVYCLPVLPETPDQWDLGQLAVDDSYPSGFSSSSSSSSNGRSDNSGRHQRHFLNDVLRSRFDTSRHHHHPHNLQRQPQEGLPQVTKRDEEEPNIPTMGLGVLSDMRKFFNELRTNLDSVEEAAVLSQELGTIRDGTIDPADFLALLARHGARSGEMQSGELGLPRNPAHMRSLMFGYNHDDQPYARTGLGK